MTFFIDNNLGKHLADGMRAFFEDVTHLQDHFPPGTPDPEWLESIGEKEWILITRDQRIRRKPAETMALRKSRVGAFFLGGDNRSRCDIVQQLVRNWPRMKELSAKTPRPFAFRVPPTGTKFDKLL